jgi:hypothetical protein
MIPLLHFFGSTEHCYIVHVHQEQCKGTHCCICLVAVVTWMCHNVTLNKYIYCLSCYCVGYWVSSDVLEECAVSIFRVTELGSWGCFWKTSEEIHYTAECKNPEDHHLSNICHRNLQNYLALSVVIYIVLYWLYFQFFPNIFILCNSSQVQCYICDVGTYKYYSRSSWRWSLLVCGNCLHSLYNRSQAIKFFQVENWTCCEHGASHNFRVFVHIWLVFYLLLITFVYARHLLSGDPSLSAWFEEKHELV